MVSPVEAWQLFNIYFKDWRTTMAKGQLRSNKEVKKQKQAKQPAAPTGGFIVPVKMDKTTKTKS
jgi:hypothetical protein